MTDSERSRIPRLLGLVALGVLAIAFAAALFGSLRLSRWKDAERKAELVEPELAGLEPIFEEARRLDRRRRAAAALSDEEPAPSAELRELRALLRAVDELPRLERPRPGEKRVPGGAEVAALEEWLDVAYRRLAAARDLQARLPAVAAEVRTLEAAALGGAPESGANGGE